MCAGRGSARGRRLTPPAADSQYHPWRFWFLYLTNITLCIQCTGLCLGTFACWQQAGAPLDALTPPPPPPPHVKPLLVLQAVTLPAAALVTALFWFLVYPSWPVSATFVVNYFVHGVNLVVAVLDTWLSCAPYPLAYAALVWPYGVAYTLFTLVYYYFGGLNEWGQPWIYIPIYWGAPDAWKGGLLSAAVLAFALPALIAAAWAFARYRDRAARCVSAEDGVELLAMEDARDAVPPLREGDDGAALKEAAPA
jgi:hypothetical protein